MASFFWDILENKIRSIKETKLFWENIFGLTNSIDLNKFLVHKIFRISEPFNFLQKKSPLVLKHIFTSYSSTPFTWRERNYCTTFLKIYFVQLSDVMVQNVFFGLGTHVFPVTCVSLGHKRKDKRQWKQFCSFSSIPCTLLEPPWGPWAAWPRCCCCWWWCWWWRWSRPCWPAPPSPIIPTPAPPLCLTKGIHTDIVLIKILSFEDRPIFPLIVVKKGKNFSKCLNLTNWPAFFLHDGLKLNSRGATTSNVAFQMSQK